jgi:hypothetical protein
MQLGLILNYPCHSKSESGVLWEVKRHISANWMRFHSSAEGRLLYCILRFVTRSVPCLSRDPWGSGILRIEKVFNVSPARKLTVHKSLPNRTWLARYREFPRGSLKRARSGTEDDREIRDISVRGVRRERTPGNRRYNSRSENAVCAHSSWIRPNDNPSAAKCAFFARETWRANGRRWNNRRFAISGLKPQVLIVCLCSKSFCEFIIICFSIGCHY